MQQSYDPNSRHCRRRRNDETGRDVMGWLRHARIEHDVTRTCKWPRDQGDVWRGMWGLRRVGLFNSTHFIIAFWILQLIYWQNFKLLCPSLCSPRSFNDVASIHRVLGCGAICFFRIQKQFAGLDNTMHPWQVQKNSLSFLYNASNFRETKSIIQWRRNYELLP
jgi:hypothetical protein